MFQFFIIAHVFSLAGRASRGALAGEMRDGHAAGKSKREFERQMSDLLALFV